MSLLPTYLWKEWRDHRGPLVATAVVLPLLMLMFELVMPARVTLNRDLPGIFALVTLAIVVIALHGDAFAGEERRGTIAFLRRQPGGWWPPFAAKLLFLAGVTLLFTSGAFGLGALLLRTFHGKTLQFFARHGALLLAELLLVPAWTVVVSIWFPRSTVSLPGALTILALFAGPIALACGLNVGLWPSDREWTIGFGWLLLAAPFVAALSFARSRFIERERWRAGAIGLLATLGVFAPAYGWTAKRVVDFRSVDPTAASFHISNDSSVVATNGRFAYVTAYHSFNDPWRWSFQSDPSSGDGPSHALCVDLLDGSWRDMGGAWSGFCTIPDSVWRNVAVPYVVLSSRSTARRSPHASPYSPYGAFSSQMPIVDAESGEVVAPDFDEAFTGARDDRGSRFQQLADDLLLPDRSRVWVDHGRLVRTTTDGGARALPDSELPSSAIWVSCESWHAHGAWLGGREWYDVLCETRFTVPDGMFVRWVHDGECYFFDIVARRFGSTMSRWNWATHEYTPIPGVAKDEVLYEMVEDGRLIVGSDRTRLNGQTVWKLALLDTTTSMREPIPIPDRFDDYTTGVTIIARTPAGTPVMTIYNAGDKRTSTARFDLAARRFDLLAPDAATPLFFVGCAAEDSAIVSDGHRLLRAWFGKPGLEVLFPKPAK
jgi:ABC-type transport system involved in multi-copper enzyme maturation permease subunit